MKSKHNKYSFLSSPFYYGWSTLFLLIYGLLLLIFVVSPGDGGWILYGNELSEGKRLYSDLNLNQQPIFPLISELISSISNNILYQHLLYFPVLLLFVFSIFRVVSVVEYKVWLRDLLILAFFFMAIRFEAYRFDDYHPLSQAGVILSLAIALNFLINNKYSYSKFFLFQGALFGFVLLVRVNEGLIILAGSSLIFLIIDKDKDKDKYYLKAPVCFLLGFFFILLMVLLSIKEGPITWFNATFLKAVGNKGGAVGVLSYPYKLILNSFASIIDNYNSQSLFKKNIVNLYLLIFLPVLYFFKSQYLKFLFISIGTTLLFIYLFLIGKSFSGFLIPTIFLINLGGFLIIGIFYLLKINGNRKYLVVILMYPLSAFLVGSLSSGGQFQDLTFPAALSLLAIAGILNFLTLGSKNLCWLKYSFYFILFIVFLEGIYERSRLPYAWHSYRVPTIFSKNYVVTKNKDTEFLFLSKDVSNLIEPVCEIVGKDNTLLSLPFSFANYYCGVPIWHGYVQSFYDTSDFFLISRILNDLEKKPPNYIFYQRQTLNLSVHENLFNNGKPLPHRRLDQLIIENINTGKWKVVYKSNLFQPSEWLLIQSSPDK